MHINRTFANEIYCGVKITNIATMLLLQITWTYEVPEVMRKRSPKIIHVKLTNSLSFGACV